VKVKLCGVKRPEDIWYMNEFQPDYVGFVFAGTKRRIMPQTAAKLAEKLDRNIQKVGVFVNEQPETVAMVAKMVGLQAIQLHGNETEEEIAYLRTRLPGCSVWKAVRVQDERSLSAALRLSADFLLLDSFSDSSYGGTGKIANLAVIQKANIARPYFLAGGLNSDNIRTIAASLHPYGVDISSGIETDGVKDRKKIETIMQIIRNIL